MSTAVESKTEWHDKKGELILVLAVDNEDGSVEIEWPNIKTRGIRVVSIKQFLSQAVPASIKASPVKEVDSKPESPKAKPAKPGQFAFAAIGALTSSFGESTTLQLADQEWLERGMHAKTVKFDIGAGGLPPEVNWEDKCAAIASIDDRAAKALASIILWGNDGAWDWSSAFNEVVYELAANMVGRCKNDGRSKPKACKHSLPELARLMARMVLYFELYQLWDVYTVKGRLLFSGIEMNDRTYSNHFLKYQKQMFDDLQDLVSIADSAIDRYRRELSISSL
ncbi:hypothetical protein J3492_00195 [Psychrobacter sp. F1192]|uniref:Uncharacterized protein n=1 Tax=Psychrobacter coccoides TaxID=2818440 RepID=A0ABS3NKM5_9GAMM|nr:hypothetical protein [Psychrobacter coccoides]MBO1529633.1 hypothetical protein [Psychrobacter coccoides]